MSYNSTITKSPNGVDLEVEVTTIDPNTGAGIPSAVQASIQRKDNGFYFDFGGSDVFDSVAEVLAPVVHDSKGIHFLNLPGAAEALRRKYWVHILITGNPDVDLDAKISDEILVEPTPGGDATEAKQDILIAGQITLDAGHTAITDNINDGVDANVTKWAGSVEVDGVPLEEFADILLSYTTGRFKINTPLDGDITFYKQDDVSPLFVLHIIPTERTRV